MKTWRPIGFCLLNITLYVHVPDHEHLYVSACWSCNSFTCLEQYIYSRCPFPIHGENKTYMCPLAGVTIVLHSLYNIYTVHCINYTSPRSFPVHEDNKTYMSMLAGVRGILSITPRGHASHFFSMTKGIQDGHWICAVRVSVLKQNVHCIHVFIVEKIILT